MLKRISLILKILLLVLFCKAQEIDFEKRFNFNKDSISLKSSVVFDKDGDIIATLRVTNISNKPVPNFTHPTRIIYITTESDTIGGLATLATVKPIILYVNGEHYHPRWPSYTYYDNEVLLSGHSSEQKQWIDFLAIGSDSSAAKKKKPDYIRLQWSYADKLSDEIIVDLKNKRIIKKTIEDK